MRIAIVGAGPSGLAALHALTAAGFDAVALERRSQIGGVWSLDGRSTAAYRSLHLITSRARTEFTALRMARGTPDYPSRDAVGAYLESYAERFGLHERIRLRTPVERAERVAGGGGAVEGVRFDVLVPGNGHHEGAAGPPAPVPGR